MTDGGIQVNLICTRVIDENLAICILLSKQQVPITTENTAEAMAKPG